MTPRQRAAAVLRSLLDPAQRRRVYAILTAATGIAVTAGLAAGEDVARVIALTTAAGDLIALAAASILAHTLDRAALYASAGAVGAALVGLGWLSQAQAAAGMEILGQVLAALGLLVAVIKTDPGTITGAPSNETQEV